MATLSSLYFVYPIHFWITVYAESVVLDFIVKANIGGSCAAKAGFWQKSQKQRLSKYDTIFKNQTNLSFGSPASMSLCTCSINLGIHC